MNSGEHRGRPTGGHTSVGQGEAMQTGLFRVLDKALFIVILLRCSDATHLLFPNSPHMGAGDSNRGVLFASLVLFSIGLAACLPSVPEILEIARRFKSLALLIVLPAVSALWSYNAGYTARRSAWLLALAAIALHLGSRCSLQTQISLTVTTVVFALLSSIAYATVHPGDAFLGGAFRGIFPAKHPLGLLAAIGILGFWCNCGRSWPSRGCGIAFCAACLLLSRYVAPLICVLIALPLTPVLRAVWSSMRWRFALLFLFVATIAVPLLLLLLWKLPEVTAFFGKEVTLTGRTDAWGIVLAALRDRPFLGHGWGSFWNFEFNNPIASRGLQWHPAHSHNAYLEVALDFGALGASIFVAACFTLVRHALGFAARPSRMCEWPLAITVFALCLGVAESMMLDMSAVWFLCLVTAAHVVKQHGTAGLKLRPNARGFRLTPRGEEPRGEGSASIACNR